MHDEGAHTPTHLFVSQGATREKAGEEKDRDTHQGALRHEQWGACVGARECPLLPVADHSVPCEHFRGALGEGARKQLHVQLAQGYGPVVVQSGGARYLG